jgi:hypothetical protein
MEKKELHNMKKHRGLCLGLGLAALLALSTTEASAGPITLVLTYSGGSTTIVSGGPGSQTGSTANNFTANTATVNGDIGSTGLTFSGIQGLSNNPGAASGATLNLSGGVSYSGTGTGTITITLYQTGFTIPSGPGTLVSSSGANYNSAMGSTQMSYSALNNAATYVGATPTPTSMYTATTSGVQALSNGTGTSVGVTANPAGYTLVDTTTITLKGAGAVDGFSDNAKFTAVPEPASIIMMLTGMPLPLVVMGLLRRRRVAAA